MNPKTIFPFILLRSLYKWIIVIVYLFLALPSIGQDTHDNRVEILLIQLENALEKGNVRALKELAGILDRVGNKERVIKMLGRYTLFPTNQIQLDTNLNRKRFVEFLNEHNEEIKYSPFLSAFYTQELEDYEVDFKISRKKNFSEKEKSSLLERYAKLLTATSKTHLEVFSKYQLQEIANLQTYESYDFLVACLKGEHLNEELLKTSYVKSNICEALISFEDPFVLEIVLEQLKKGNIEKDAALRMLARFTNIEIEAKSTKKIINSYTNLLDSLKTISAIRNLGFEKESTIRNAYFEMPVDYYGFMLASFYDNPWLRENALREMMATEHPRALFYLAAVLYSNRDGSALDRKILERTFGRYLNIAVELNHNEQFEGLGDNLKSPQFYLNHVIYWAKNYIDYEFDANRKVFVNVKLEEENEESAMRLFEKLTSDSDFEALAAYQSLIKYTPDIVTKLFNKFQPVLRRANVNLPDFRYGFLESLATLHEFCEIEGVEIELSEERKATIDQLKENISNKQYRYEIENDIINNLTIKELTALEIEALVHSRNIEFNFSMSRILDVSYSKLFNEITTDLFQLRLFLKKSILYNNIGVGGVSNRYLTKISSNKNKKLYKKLELLSTKEYDIDIKDAITYVMPQDIVSVNKEVALAFFLNAPLEYGDRELNLIESPDKKALKTIFKKIKSSKSKEEIVKYFDYLFLHNDPSLTPFLMNSALRNHRVIATNNGKEQTVSSFSVLLLENIYDFSFVEQEDYSSEIKAEKWLDWARINEDLSQWYILFFGKKVNNILSKEQIGITELNTILSNDLCNRAIEEKCLKVLPKLKKPNNIRKLKFKNLLPVSDLVYFENIDFKNKYLDNVLSFFETKETVVLLEFVKKYVVDLSPWDEGKIYNRLSDLSWFLPIVLTGEDSLRNTVINALDAYLNESSFISEFEEKRILKRIFLLENSDKSIGEQLKFAKNYGDDDKQQYQIQQQLLEEISFDELIIFMDHIDELVTIENKSSFLFLEKKFGLPAYFLESIKGREAFKKDLATLDEIEFYKKYLPKSGLSIFNDEQELDYDKFRDVLVFDVVSPFSSTVSRNRMHYVIAVLRLLNKMYPEQQNPLAIKDEIRSQAINWVQFLNQENLFSTSSFHYSFNDVEY